MRVSQIKTTAVNEQLLIAKGKQFTSDFVKVPWQQRKWVSRVRMSGKFGSGLAEHSMGTQRP